MTAPTTPELLPCPFCGGASNIGASSNGFASCFQLCLDCGAEGPAAHTVAKGEASWNTRAALSAPVSPGWISVDERLPKPNVDVLAVMRGKTKRSKSRIITAAIEPSDGSWYELYGDDVEYPITHWQPMPAAPALVGPVEGAPK